MKKKTTMSKSTIFHIEEAIDSINVMPTEQIGAAVLKENAIGHLKKAIEKIKAET